MTVHASDTDTIPFTDADWARIERDWRAWWAHELDRPLVWMEGSTGSTAELAPAPNFVAQMPLDLPADEVVARYHARFCRRRWYGDAFPKWFVNFGPGILAGFLGAEVMVDDHTVWFEQSDAPPVGELPIASEPGGVWWRRVHELSRVASERWCGRVAVSHTDIGGNLDVLASLRGTNELLFDCLDDPEAVAARAAEITRCWLRTYDELDRVIRAHGHGTTPWAAIWSPERCYMLQCDFAYMISPEMFERFVMPDLEACCDHLDHGFYHLDGKGQLPHLDQLLDLPRLRGIQWIPGAGQPEPQEWPEVLGRIRTAGKLCQLYLKPEGALRVVREHGGRGFMLAIEADFTPEEAAAFQAELAAADRGA